MVWIVPSGDARRLDFAAVSDSAIVSGLVYLALRVYSGRSAQEILATPADYIADIGLAKHLSPTRSNGLRSEEHTSELQSLMRISYAVFCLKKKKQTHTTI